MITGGAGCTEDNAFTALSIKVTLASKVFIFIIKLFTLAVSKLTLLPMSELGEVSIPLRAV